MALPVRHTTAVSTCLSVCILAVLRSNASALLFYSFCHIVIVTWNQRKWWAFWDCQHSLTQFIIKWIEKLVHVNARFEAFSRYNPHMNVYMNKYVDLIDVTFMLFAVSVCCKLVGKFSVFFCMNQQLLAVFLEF